MNNSYLVKIEEDAKFDIADSFDYYNEVSPYLADKFLNEVKETLDYISLNPLLFKIVYNDYRQVPVKRFPYVIVYKVDESIIKVYRLFPTKKDPKTKF